MNVSSIDHVVLTVTDIDVAVDFYKSVLGMESEIFAGGRVALKFGVQKINLHKSGHEFEPHAGATMPGSADLCFITDVTLADAMQHVVDAGVSIIEGPLERHGAKGKIESFYFRDPDNNLIEVASQL